jgi:hypothetical protein
MPGSLLVFVLSRSCDGRYALGLHPGFGILWWFLGRLFEGNLRVHLFGDLDVTDFAGEETSVGSSPNQAAFVVTEKLLYLQAAWLRMLVKEPHHLRRGVEAIRVGVRAGAAATGPGMPEPVDVPTLRDLTPGLVSVNGAAIGVTAGYLTLAHGRRGITRAVPAVGGAVTIVLE